MVRGGIKLIRQPQLNIFRGTFYSKLCCFTVQLESDVLLWTGEPDLSRISEADIHTGTEVD